MTGLTNEVPHTFQLRVVSGDGDGAAAMAGPVTPTPGICDRTQQVRDEILRQLSGVDDCAAVTVADLETVHEAGYGGQEHHVAEGGRLRRPDGGDGHSPDKQQGDAHSPRPCSPALTALENLNLEGDALSVLPAETRSPA